MPANNTRNASIKINFDQQTRRVDTEEKLIKYIRTKLGEPLIVVDVTDDQILQAIDDTFAKWTLWAYDGHQNQVFVIQTYEDIQDYILDDRVRAIYSVSFADGLSGYGGGSGSGGVWGGAPLGDFMPPMYMPYINIEGQASQLEQGNFGSFLYSVSGVAGGVTGPHTGATQSSAEALGAAYGSLVDQQQRQNLFGKNVSFEYNANNHIMRIFEKLQGPVAIEASLDYIPNPNFDRAYGNWFIKEYALNQVKLIWANNVGKYDSSLIGGSTINHQKLHDEAQTEIDRLNDELMDRTSEALGIFSG